MSRVAPQRCTVDICTRERASCAAPELGVEREAGKDGITMTEEQIEARRALQESMDLRDQGHS